MNSKAKTCAQKDGYLGKWLTPEQRAKFEAHLADCPECRPFVQDNDRLDRLLARADAALLPVPARLLDEIDQRLRAARRRRTSLWTAGLAAAAILLCTVATGFLLKRAPAIRPRPLPVLTHHAPPSEPAPGPRSLVQVTIENPDDVIAVPQKTENPSVTIIWMYPTIKAAQEPNPDPSRLLRSPERNGI